MIEQASPKRSKLDVPSTPEGVKGLINRVQALHNDDGTGPEILARIKNQVATVRTTDEERANLEQCFDDKLSELLLKDMDKFPDKKERNAKGFNRADHVGHQRILGMYLKYDIPQLPFFSEERRAELVTKAQQKLWAKGFIPTQGEKGE